MKVRQGFVSNSSSSSFICDISGADASGWDIGLYDAGMFQCENGHTFCEGYVEDVETEAVEFTVRKFMEKYPDEFDKAYEDYDEEELEDIAYQWDIRYEFPKQFCPLCSLNNMADRDIVAMELKIRGISREEYVALVKERFGTFDDLKTYIKG